MARPIGWQKKDPEGGKFKVEARIYGDSLTFVRQFARFDNWEEFEPEEEDWDMVNHLAENKHQRGKLTGRNMKLIRARGAKF